MTEPTNPLSASPFAPRLLPALLVLFVGSGCSALVGAVVWLRLLQLVVGSTPVSLGLLLGTFMGGMCLGSLALPRLVSPGRHPLRVYALLQAGIGALGLLILFSNPLVFRLYAGNGLSGQSGILLRGLIGALCLLPPALLLGATLPAVARGLRATPQGVAWLGYFFTGNIAGAVFGCLLAELYLLRLYDVAVATYVAVALNVAVAVMGLWLASALPHAAPAGEAQAAPAAPEAGAPAPGPVYAALVLSGATALGAEVVWARLLSLMLGTTVYTFSLILAVFLTGLGIGSSLGSLLARKTTRPRAVLGACQLLLMVAIAWAALLLARSLPNWPVDPSVATSFWDHFLLDILRCAVVMLPATVLWGASFPLGLAALTGSDEDLGRIVGRAYAANTVGAIVGAVGTSVFFIGAIGTQQSQRLLIGVSALAGAFVLMPPLRQNAAAGTARHPRRGTGILLASLALGFLLAWSVDKVPSRVIAGGRYPPNYFKDSEILYAGEGINSSIAVLESDDGHRTFHVNGKAKMSTTAEDLRVQRMLGHVPALLHPKPKSVLVVGCGAGVTAGSFVLHPGVERIVICEIEPLVPRFVAPLFSQENYDVIDDRRVEVVHDDARHYILTTQEKFDVITTDPIHPWVKGAATLNTEEYFELVKQHLTPGGIVAQWVPIYESSKDTVKSQFATFFGVFPDGVVWSNDYDVVLMGQAEPTRVDLDGLQRRLRRKDHADVRRSLAEVELGSAVALLATFNGRASDLADWLEGSVINRDRNLRLQYIAGMELSPGEADQVVTDLMAYRQFPEGYFVGAPQAEQALRKAIEQARGLSEEEKALFEVALAEIEQFGEDKLANALVQEVTNLYSVGSLEEQKAWLQKKAIPEITEDEQARFDAYVEGLKSKEEQDEEINAWTQTSNAGKRYYLRYLYPNEEARALPEAAPAAGRRAARSGRRPQAVQGPARPRVGRARAKHRGE